MTKLSRASFFLFCLVISALVAPSYAAPVIIPAPPQLTATAYLLIDADTGKVLVEHNADQSLPPASLTKMMTAYIVSEEIMQGRLRESDLVNISDNAWRLGGAASGGSTMFLEPRTQVPVIDLLRGVIIQSGNDASIALAEHIAGSEYAFADVMNQQARLLGMTATNYANATGLPAEGHMTTARDLGRLAQAIINDHPDHYPIHAEKYFTYNGINQANRNKLLFTDKFVDGIKTGHTEEAGYCLVSTAKRNDMRLIAVVMGTASEKTRAAESQRLLAYGFRYYQTATLYTAQQVLNSATVWGGLAEEISLQVAEDIVATIPRGSHTDLVATTEIDTVIKAPINKGQVLGRLVLTLNDEFLLDADLVAANAVDQAGFFSRLWDDLLLFFEAKSDAAQ